MNALIKKKYGKKKKKKLPITAFGKGQSEEVKQSLRRLRFQHNIAVQLKEQETLMMSRDQMINVGQNMMKGPYLTNFISEKNLPDQAKEDGRFVRFNMNC